MFYVSQEVNDCYENIQTELTEVSALCDNILPPFQ
jgi:hypothetical protein